MFLEYAKLKGYIGLKRGSGIDEIEIPFYKMKSKICFIVGNNGSGKSTIKNALHPYIDSADCFIPKEIAQKSLRYLLDDGTRIFIDIIHGVKDNGDRASAKAYIKKVTTTGEEINLNPNGNIGSYKDVIEDVFDLDPNFLSLISLGCEEKGLAVKTPTERKKIVSERLETIEVYNNIGRTITKRCNTRKAIINSITAKIDSIGNEDLLNETIASKESLITNLTSKKEGLISERGKLELMVDQLDPDKTILTRYNDLSDKYRNIVSKISEDISIHDIDNSISILEAQVIEANKKKAEYEKELYHVDTILPTLLAEHEETSKLIQLKTSRLDSLENESNYESIKDTYESSIKDVEEYEKVFEELGIENPMSISKDEYIIGLNTLVEIKESLSSISSSITDNILNSALEYTNNGTFPSLKELNDELSSNTNRIQELKIKLVEIDNNIKRMNVLSNRPLECSIDDCFFIREAVEIAKKNPVQIKENIVNEIESLTARISAINTEIANTEELCNTVQYLSSVKRNIDKNYNIIIKLPNGDKFTDIKYFVEDLLHGSTFANMIDKLYSSITFANIFDSYRSTKELITNLESDMKLYESKVSIIEEIQNDLSDLRIKSDIMISKLDEVHNRKQMIRFNLDESELAIKTATEKIKSLNEIKSCIELKSTIEKELESLAKDSDKIKQCIARINQIIQEISIIDSQMTPIKNSISEAKYSLKMLNEYKNELENTLASVNVLEIIKKHSVPKTGIQIVYMKMYFGKILKIANSLLANFFDGALTLTDYEINDDNFTISCYDSRSGLTNKDISSCSESEKCIIGLLLGYGFMYQSSSLYNIPMYDEIDAGLDSDNRMSFIPSINALMAENGIKQCIMISHSSETDLQYCDSVILRLPNRRLTDDFGNVIYRV